MGLLNSKKAWPIRPGQLTTDCLGCQKSIDHTNKCDGCGIGTESFIRNSLLDIFSQNTLYPITLIEKVTCPVWIENHPLPSEKKGEEWYIVESATRNKFRYFKGELYHVYDLSENLRLCESERNVYEECEKCKERRRNNLEACILSDVKAAAYVYSAECTDCVENKLSMYTVDNGISVAYHEYTCYVSNLRELAFPIRIDSHCVAVMIIGQIPEAELGAAKPKICKQVCDFTTRMQGRTEIRRSDFLYHFLSKCIADIERKDRENESPEDIICDIYEMISNTFNYSMLGVHLCNDGYDVLSYIPTDSQPVVGQIKPVQRKELVSLVKDEKWNEVKKALDLKDSATVFCRKKKLGPFCCFILTAVEQATGSNPNSMEIEQSFFNTLNSSLFSLLMTEATAEKHNDQLRMLQIFSHEMNQKITVVESHTASLSKRIETNAMGDLWFFDQISDYFKDMGNTMLQLRYFLNEMRQSFTGEKEETRKRWFKPYSAFLFNYKEYYDGAFPERHVCLPTVPDVIANPQRYPQMYAEQESIDRCVSNLLNNAVKYSYQFTNVFLDCYFEYGFYHIVVTNYGPPIPDELLKEDALFERGTSKGKTYKKPKGSGLGLNIVKKICEDHEGDVKLLTYEKLSDYAIPVLHRLMGEYERSGSEARKEAFLQRFHIGLNKMEDYKQEYNKIQVEPCDPRNRVLRLNGFRSLFREVCMTDPVYSETMTGRFIETRMFSPTYRIQFEMVIPQ